MELFKLYSVCTALYSPKYWWQLSTRCELEGATEITTIPLRYFFSIHAFETFATWDGEILSPGPYLPCEECCNRNWSQTLAWDGQCSHQVCPFSRAVVKKLPPSWWCKRTRMYSVIPREATSPKPRGQQCRFLLESLRDNSFHASLLASSGCQKSLVFHDL